MRRLSIFLMYVAGGLFTQWKTPYDGGSIFGPPETFFILLGVVAALLLSSL